MLCASRGTLSAAADVRGIRSQSRVQVRLLPTLAVPTAVAAAATGAAILARLVYLGAWNREVYATEDPGLREPALDSGSRRARLRASLIDPDLQRFSLSAYLERSGATTDSSRALGDTVRSGAGRVLAAAVLGALAVVTLKYWGRCGQRSSEACAKNSLGGTPGDAASTPT